MRTKLRSLGQSFCYAFSGLFHCIRSERNFRIHIAAAVAAILLSRFYQFSRVEYAILFLTIGFVLVCEMLNTAIEALVDLASPEVHPLAKIAKDVAAGAVLISAIVSVGVGVCLFARAEVLTEFAAHFREAVGFLICYIVMALCFIFGLPSEKTTKKQEDDK